MKSYLHLYEINLTQIMTTLLILLSLIDNQVCAFAMSPDYTTSKLFYADD